MEIVHIGGQAHDITAKQELMHASPCKKDDFYSQKSSFTHGRVIFTELGAFNKS
jgi:hypothetical protein